MPCDDPEPDDPHVLVGVSLPGDTDGEDARRNHTQQLAHKGVSYFLEKIC